MQKVLTTLLLGSSIFCNGQSLDEWMARKQRLQTKQTQINDSLRIVDENIQRIKIDRIKNEAAHRSTTVRVSTQLTKNPTNAASSGEVIRFLDRGDTVEVFGWQWSHMKVSTNKNEIGFVSEFDVDRRDDDFDSFVEALKAKFMEEYRQQEAAKEREKSESAQKNKKLADDKANYQKAGAREINFRKIQ